MGARLILFGLLVFMLCSPSSVADSIKVGDKVYEDVIVVDDKGSSFYFIRIPKEGKTLSEFKSSVNPEDIVITQDEEKRDALIEAYNRTREERGLTPARQPQDILNEQPASNSKAMDLTPVQEQDSKQHLEHFKKMQEMISLAQFEGELERWRDFSDEERKAVINQTLGTYYAGQNSMTARIQSSENALGIIGASLKVNNENRSEQALAISYGYAEERANLEEIYNDPRYQWDKAMLDIAFDDLIAHRALMHTRYRIRSHHWFEINAASDRVYEYSVKTNMHLNRLNAQATATSQAHEATRQTHRDQLSALNGQAAQLEKNETRARNIQSLAAGNAHNQEKRNSSKLARLALLDLAVEKDYKPRLRTIAIESYGAAHSMETPPFRISAELWRIEWSRQRMSNDSVRRIDVFSTASNKLVKSIIPKSEPHLNFYIMQDAGEYYLKIRPASGMECEVKIAQIHD